MNNSCRIDLHEVGEEEKNNMIKVLNMHTIAVVGISKKSDRASNYVARYLQEKGYNIIPVRPGVKEIMGKRCYRDLEDIEEKVEVVNVFRRSEFCAKIAEKAVKIGAKALWMQEGIVSKEAQAIAQNAGLIVIMDYCLEKAYAKYIENNQHI